MSDDPFVEFKNRQKEGWAHFQPVENFTCLPAAQLVRYAGVERGQSVLDVGCGTGVVAICAATKGAKVTGLDLTPELLKRAKENATLAEVEIQWVEGDAEKLPFADASFDVVVSQFGHMFAPRPDVATRELWRVLKPGGRLAFSTWPPEHFTGKMFQLVGKFSPQPPPAGFEPPSLWGDPSVVRQRLGNAARELEFERGTAIFPGVSLKHIRDAFERTVGPVLKLVQTLPPDKVKELRRELEAIMSTIFRDNALHQHYLMTRALK